jgi:BirA family biotin operon repressor/biotin-[acetyl-CoA-carboxylase] ligase
MLCITWGLATTLGYAGIPVQIKWFNDLVIGQRKLGGVLIETRVRQGRIAQAVVGLGLNWKNPVPETGITLQDVIATMPPTSRSGSSLGLSALEDWILEDIAAIALKSMMAGYRYWQEHGIQRILPAYEALLSRIGSRIHLDQGTGQILGVTAEGHLRVRMLESQDGSGQGSSPEDSEESMATLLQFQPGEIQLGYGE